MIKCLDISDITREDFCSTRTNVHLLLLLTERAESPRKGLLVDPPFPGQDQSRVEEPITWCRFTKFSKSFYQNPPRRRATEDNVDIQDVE